MVFKIVKFLSGPSFLIFTTSKSLEKYVCSLSFYHSYIKLYVTKYTTLESYFYNFKLFPQNYGDVLWSKTMKNVDLFWQHAYMLSYVMFTSYVLYMCVCFGARFCEHRSVQTSDEK